MHSDAFKYLQEGRVPYLLNLMEERCNAKKLRRGHERYDNRKLKNKHNLADSLIKDFGIWNE